MHFPLCFPDEIRQNVEDAVYRMKPWIAEDGSPYFGGWARMAQVKSSTYACTILFVYQKSIYDLLLWISQNLFQLPACPNRRAAKSMYCAVHVKVA